MGSRALWTLQWNSSKHGGALLILEPRVFSLTEIKSTFPMPTDGCTSKFPPLSSLLNALTSDNLFGASVRTIPLRQLLPSNYWPIFFSFSALDELLL